MDQNNHLDNLFQNDYALQVVAKSLVDSFNELYQHLDELKENALNQNQIAQLSNFQTQIDGLATKALSESQDFKKGMKMPNYDLEIKNLKLQLEQLQKRHDQLAEKHEDLQKRVTNLECTMVSRQEFEDLKNSCQQRFSLFDNRFCVAQEQNDRLFLYINDQFKRRIKPTDQLKQKLSELMKTNYRLFEYAKKMYWSLINQILAYRTLSSGMVQKGSFKNKYEQSSLFQEAISVVSSATYLIAGVPFVGGAFLIVKQLASIFFNKREDAVTTNMCIRVEGYFTQDQISEDVARAVLELINNPNIQARLTQFGTKSMIITALSKFFQFISTTNLSPQLLADVFVSRLSRIKKEKQTLETSFLTENVITDTSLIMWKMAQCAPADKRFAVSSAVKALFSKNNPNNPPCYLHQKRLNFSAVQTNLSTQTSFILSRSTLNKENISSSNYCELNSHFPVREIAKDIQNSVQITPDPPKEGLSQQRYPYFKLKIIGAHITQRRQFFGRGNLYCMIKYRNQVLRTQNQKIQDLKTTWEQQFILESSQFPSTITIQVYEKQLLFQDEFMGCANLMDSQVDKNEQQIQLWIQDRNVGQICICLSP